VGGAVRLELADRNRIGYDGPLSVEWEDVAHD
jgi:hypothetical protein